MPPATRTRPTHSRAASSTKPKAATLSPDDLADKLASKLTISNSKGKLKATEPSPEERKASSMRAVNTASKSLSAIVESGWKASEAKASDRTTAASVTKHSAVARKELAALRTLDPGQVDMERAASSIAGKLVALEAYNDALGILQDMHASLIALYSFSPSLNPSSSPFDLLALPLPNAQLSDIHVSLISTYLLHVTITVLQTTKDLTALCSVLLDSHTPTLLAWASTLSQLPEKQHDHLFTRAYTIVSRYSSTQTTSVSAYSLRVFALLCLVRTRPSVVAPKTFWEQAVKYAAAFANSDSSNPRESAKTVSDAFARLVESAETRPDASEFMAGPTFARFCEYWSRFAKQAGELATLERIERLTTTSGGEVVQTPQDRMVIETSTLCTIVARGLAVFEHWSEYTSDFGAKLIETSAAIKQCGPSLVSDGAEHDRVKRGVERLRRAATTVLEPPSSSKAQYPPDVISGARAILEQVTNVLCDAVMLHKSQSATTLKPALDGLFTLSRTVFVLNKPDSYATARSHLDRAAALVTAASKGSAEPLAIANYMRCVAGVYHLFTGQLHQSGRYDHTVRFLEEGCRLSALALETHRTAKADCAAMDVDGEGTDGKEQAWKLLPEQLSRRWELLGVCHAKTGDRKLAYEPFLKSIKTFPYSQYDFAKRACSTPTGQLFSTEDAPALQQLATLVDRATYIAACELFHSPATVSALSWFSQDVDGERKDVVGALVERQIASLEESKWKKGVRDVLHVLLDDALLLYDVEERPLRHVRVVLKRLELACQSSAETTAGDRTEKLAEDAEKILAREDFALDAPLKCFVPEFTVTLHLWRAIYAHRARDPALVPAVVTHAEDACRALREMAPPAPATVLPRPSGIARAVAVDGPSKRVTRGSAKAPAKAKATATRARAPPVTPRKRRVLNPVPTNLPIVDVSPPRTGPSTAVNVQGKMPFDDFAKLIGLVRTVSHLIGLVGHVLIRVQLLNAARRLTERHTGAASEVYVTLTIDTAHEYVKLGRAEKAASILTHVLPTIRAGTLPQDVAILFLLRYSETLAAAGEVLKASMTYCDAVAAASDFIVEEKGLPTAQKIRVRAALLERAAEAALSYAAVQDARDDPTSSIEGLLQALRLWNRAIDTISRLQPSLPKENVDDNPFEVKPEGTEDGKAAVPEIRVLSPRATQGSIATDASGWRLSEGLLSTLLALSQSYAARGSAREAEFFAQQTKGLAEALYAPVMISRALAQLGELQIQLGDLPEGHKSLMNAAALVMHLKGPDMAEVQRLLGRYSQLSADSKGAQQLFEEAASMLDELGNMFATLDGGASARKSLVSPKVAKASKPQSVESVMAPSLLARVLRHQISLLHEAGAEYTSLLERFAKLPQSVDAKAEEVALRAKLTLDDVYTRFRADMFLSSLAESAMTIPMGLSGDGSPSAASHDMLDTLSTAEKLFWEHMGYIARRGHVSSVREAAVCLALIRTFRTSLGRGDVHTPVLAAQLLDASTVTTLRREMLDVIRHKFFNVDSADDLQWPLITPNGSPLPPPSRSKRVARLHGSSLFSAPDEEPFDDIDLKSYWEAVTKRYEAQCFDAHRMSTSQADSLPPHWTVVNVSVTEDRHTMFITRQQAGRKPLIFCLPLKGRREGQEDEYLTYDDAIKELQDIVTSSTEKTRQAANINKEDRAARVAWWKDRTELDTRLRDLLADIEFCWLGAFKTIFSTSHNHHPEDLNALRSRLDSVFKGNLVFQDKKPKIDVGLDDGLLECFSALPPSCRDEELEDLVYFILDLYQFHGIPVAASEVDVDQVVVELRNALEEHSARFKAHVTHEDDDNHIFLVLDKNVQGIPWESLPVLRGKSVSRIPSMDFLIDRLEFAHWRKWEEGSPQEGGVDRTSVDPRKTYFVLNPSGDLKSTEGRFNDWLQSMKPAGWDGVVGRAPSEQQVLDALANRDLLIYFGHGGAEQYVRAHKVRHLPRCAATMLWGCSSGTLKYMGEFDRTGTPYHYMLAGCPTLVANLWDVTDREIDKFSQSVFDDLRLTADDVSAWRPDGESTTRPGMSVVKAVARGRDSCKLKYMTGAAPVVYGIPFYL